MSGLQNRIRSELKKWQMLAPGDLVLAGLSGGADSVCLLHVLANLREELGIALLAVHIHHGLRGEAADADEAFVKNLCDSMDIPLRIFHEDVRSYAKEQKLSEEEAGRELRRKRFLQVCEEEGAQKIALAHHRNDDAETVLFSLCRGSGLRGLTGIAPVDGVWIRPLISVGREEIEAYLEEKGIPYCIDETNASPAYTRNRVRHQVLPLLEEAVNPQAVRHIHETAVRLRNLQTYVDEEVARQKERCVQVESGSNSKNTSPGYLQESHSILQPFSEEARRTGNVDEGCSDGNRGNVYVLHMEEFRQIPTALQPEVILSLLADVSGKKKDLSSVHVEAVMSLLDRQVGRSIELPYGVRAERAYEGVRLRKHFPKEEREGQAETGAEDTAEHAERRPVYETRIFDYDGTESFPQSTYTKWFDYAIMKNALELRHYLPGDTIVISEQGMHQKVKKFFVNEKIPQEEREKLWLFADGNEILWIVGYRQSKAYQVSERTRQVLEIRMMEEAYGRDS